MTISSPPYGAGSGHASPKVGHAAGLGGNDEGVSYAARLSYSRSGQCKKFGPHLPNGRPPYLQRRLNVAGSQPPPQYCLKLTTMPRKQIEDIRCPAIKGLPEDTVHLLHYSVVDIVKMRRSIDSTDQAIALSSKAIFDTCELLKSLGGKGM